MKKTLCNTLMIALCALLVSPIHASTLKITNQRQDGLGVFVAADFGAPLRWEALDPMTSVTIDSGLAKISKVIWYDPKQNLFWETDINQPGVLVSVGPAGTFTIDVGPAHRYESPGNPIQTGRPRAISWSIATYK